MGNREQRRAQAKSKKTPAEYHKEAKERYEAEQRLKGMMLEAFRNGEQNGFYSCLTVFCYELRNVYGFGEKRITRLVKKVIDLGDSMVKGYVSVDDILAQLKEETGIVISWDEKGYQYYNGKDDDE